MMLTLDIESLKEKAKGNVRKPNGDHKDTTRRARKILEILKRDKFTCQKCQQKGGRLIAHHKQGFADYPKLRFDVNNGITFCEKCHEKFHKIYRKWHNTEKQVKEFLGKRRWN